jgi:peptide/nickel transport system permease protein
VRAASSLLRDAGPAFVGASAVVAFALLVAIAAPFLTLPDPSAMDAVPYLPPSPEHWFGTDNFGRDVLARVVHGTRLALVVAVVSTLLSSCLGVLLGSLSGYHGGVLDAVLSRAFDVFLLIPTFFLVLLIVALFGSGVGYTILAIALTTWPRSARIMRSQVLGLKSRVYVQAALAAGASSGTVLARHVVPNGIAPLVTDGTILMGLAILTEAGLSFLGLGDQDGVSWGRMIFEGQRHLRLAPWISIFPGLALLVLVAALNVMGDGLNRALNPQLARLSRGAGRAPRVERPAASPDAAAPILEVRDLTLAYRLDAGEIRAVDRVSFEIPRGGSLGVVGESGSGKSSLGAAILQVAAPNARLVSGDVSIAGVPVLEAGRVVVNRGRDAISALRWTTASIVFQSAMNALNPVMTIERQLIEAYRLHRPEASAAQAREQALRLFDVIGIPRERIGTYPHELSGGMRQRAMIALALLLGPALVVADEPTTALDVLVQDQILGEIDSLRRSLGLSLVLVSHDLGTVVETCDRVAVMYAGEIVEIAPTRDLIEDPRHPYTAALIAALPSLAGEKRPLSGLPGEPFVPKGDIVGCRFAARCARVADVCRATTPPDMAIGPDRRARCHFAVAP